MINSSVDFWKPQHTVYPPAWQVPMQRPFHLVNLHMMYLYLYIYCLYIIMMILATISPTKREKNLPEFLLKRKTESTVYLEKRSNSRHTDDILFGHNDLQNSREGVFEPSKGFKSNLLPNYC